MTLAAGDGVGSGRVRRRGSPRAKVGKMPNTAICNAASKPSAATVTAVCAAINAFLAEASAFYHQTRDLDWHLSAGASPEYHIPLEELAEAILASTDELADRVRQIGGVAVIGQISDVQQVKNHNQRIVSPVDIFGRLVPQNEPRKNHLRKAPAVADEKVDLAPTRLLETLIAPVDHRTWSLSKAGIAPEAGGAVEAGQSSRSSADGDCRAAQAAGQLHGRRSGYR
jgi:starvation-inducible DNA-binding protein